MNRIDLSKGVVCKQPKRPIGRPKLPPGAGQEVHLGVLFTKSEWDQVSQLMEHFGSNKKNKSAKIRACLLAIASHLPNGISKDKEAWGMTRVVFHKSLCGNYMVANLESGVYEVRTREEMDRDRKTSSVSFDRFTHKPSP